MLDADWAVSRPRHVPEGAPWWCMTPSRSNALVIAVVAVPAVALALVAVVLFASTGSWFTAFVMVVVATVVAGNATSAILTVRWLGRRPGLRSDKVDHPPRTAWTTRVSDALESLHDREVARRRPPPEPKVVVVRAPEDPGPVSDEVIVEPVPTDRLPAPPSTWPAVAEGLPVDSAEVAPTEVLPVPVVGPPPAGDPEPSGTDPELSGTDAEIERDEAEEPSGEQTRRSPVRTPRATSGAKDKKGDKKPGPKGPPKRVAGRPPRT